MKSQEEHFENIKTYKLLANKSLGQNFLINQQIAETICDSLSIEKEDKVLEIGAGLGSLSYFLAKKEGSIKLIDIDERMLMSLHDSFDSCSNIQIARQNVLKEDLSSYTKIIGNLPYYITSSIIEHILLNATNVKNIVLMTQKEVYPKLLKSNISPLSLMLNYVADISSLNNVGRNNFTPVPHVDSGYFILTPNENIKKTENKELYKLICKLFLLRRKTILNNLTNVIKDKEKSIEILSKLNVSQNMRPEQLDINFYISLYFLLKSYDFLNRI